MKKIAILTSLLALTACGGGSGGGDVVPTSDPVITQDMINTGRVAQSQELQKKLDTIKYVEDNLGSLLENNELTGANINQSRSATTDRMLTGLTLKDINARYQQALEYFGILQKVLNADTNTTETITNKEIKIAYSLSSAKPYDKITQADLPGINIEKTAEETTVEINTVFSNIQITITDKIETNIDLKESATDTIIENIAEQVPEIKSEEPIDPNAALVNPNMLANLGDMKDLETMFDEFVFKIDENGRITGIVVESDESLEGKEGKFILDRQGNTANFSNNKDVWFFDFIVQHNDGHKEEESLEGLSKKYTDREELVKLIQYKFEHGNGRYNDVSTEERNRIYQYIREASDAELDAKWYPIKFTGAVQSLGKSNHLKYSDFGHYTLDEFNFTWVYQGGIEDKKIDPSKLPNEKMVFNGTAIGNLQSNYYVDGVNIMEDEEHDGKNNTFITTNTGAANLTFENGTEKLHMPFNDWYTVDVVKNGDYADHVQFTGDDSKIAEHIRLTYKDITYTDENNCHGNCGHEMNERAKWNWTNDDIHSGTQTRITTNYYGDNNKPGEATAFMNHVDDNYNLDDQGRQVHDQVWFDVVFGGTKQQ